MLSYPQKEHSKERTLLVIICCTSFGLHSMIVVLLFLSDHLLPTRALVLKSAAPVTVGRLHGGGRRGHPQEQQSSVPKQAEQTEKKQPEPSVPIAKETVVSKPSSEQKKEQKNSMTEKKAIEKKATIKTEPTGPVFSELKKKYTNLKKAEKPVKKIESVNSVEKKAQEEKPVKSENVPQVMPEKTESHGALTKAQPVVTEQLEFAAGGDGIEQEDGSPDGIVSEIARHYYRPPGFDDHEPFTFTFEIKNGKATAISPRGPEPLVLYSALKNAVLRSSFALYKHTKRIELLIK